MVLGRYNQQNCLCGALVDVNSFRRQLNLAVDVSATAEGKYSKVRNIDVSCNLPGSFLWNPEVPRELVIDFTKLQMGPWETPPGAQVRHRPGRGRGCCTLR